MGQNQQRNQNIKNTNKICFNEEHYYILDFYRQKFGSNDITDYRQLLNVFPQRTLFCKQFYKWMKILIKSEEVTKVAFLYTIELFLIDPKNLINFSFKNHTCNQLEIFIYFCLNSENFVEKKITKNQSEFFIKILFNFFLEDNNEKYADFFIKQFNFDMNENSYQICNVVDYIQKVFPCINHYVKEYFYSLIFKHKEIQYPKVPSQSNILNKEFLILLGLMVHQIQSSKKMKLIYDFQSRGKSFYNMMDSIKDLHGPCIVLIQNQYHTSTQENSIGVFGVYTDCIWSDSIIFFGNFNNFLFALQPFIRSYFPYNGQGGKNYIYVNSKKHKNATYKRGMGFGGNEYKNYRIWIDKKIKDKSYSKDFGKNFENGPLTEDGSEFLNIKNFEIWKFVQTLQLIMNFKQMIFFGFFSFFVFCAKMSNQAQKKEIKKSALQILTQPIYKIEDVDNDLNESDYFYLSLRPQEQYDFKIILQREKMAPTAYVQIVYQVMQQNKRVRLDFMDLENNRVIYTVQNQPFFYGKLFYRKKEDVKLIVINQDKKAPLNIKINLSCYKCNRSGDVINEKNIQRSTKKIQQIWKINDRINLKQNILNDHTKQVMQYQKQSERRQILFTILELLVIFLVTFTQINIINKLLKKDTIF